MATCEICGTSERPTSYCLLSVNRSRPGVSSVTVTSSYVVFDCCKDCYSRGRRIQYIGCGVFAFLCAWLCLCIGGCFYSQESLTPDNKEVDLWILLGFFLFYVASVVVLMMWFVRRRKRHFEDILGSELNAKLCAFFGVDRWGAFQTPVFTRTTPPSNVRKYSLDDIKRS